SKLRPPKLKSWLLCLMVGLLVGLGISRARYDLRSYSLLAHFLNPEAIGPILRWETHTVTEQRISFSGNTGSVQGRLYLPNGVTRPAGMVVVHGMHHLGIDEPRLVSFSRAAAGNGFAVFTPEVDALADYRVDAASIATIGESAAWLENRLGR